MRSGSKPILSVIEGFAGVEHDRLFMLAHEQRGGAEDPVHVDTRGVE